MLRVIIKGKCNKEHGPLLCDIKYSPEEKTLQKRYAHVSIQKMRWYPETAVKPTGRVLQIEKCWTNTPHPPNEGTSAWWAHIEAHIEQESLLTPSVILRALGNHWRQTDAKPTRNTGNLHVLKTGTYKRHNFCSGHFSTRLLSARNQFSGVQSALIKIKFSAFVSPMWPLCCSLQIKSDNATSPPGFTI